LELQRHAMLMFTSCGWFFDEISGIETVQILRYAERVLQLTREVFGRDLTSPFLEILEKAKSNVAAYGDGRSVFERFVKPARADLKKIAAHYAMSSLFREYAKEEDICCYGARQEDYRVMRAGKATLVLGRTRFTSRITRESGLLSFLVLHLGDHNLSCGVREFQGPEGYEAMAGEVSEAFSRADFPGTIRCLDKHFGPSTYSLSSLFLDEQRRILSLILQSTIEDAEGVYRRLYDNHAPMIRFLKDAGIPLPKALHTAAGFLINGDLHRAFSEETLSLDRIRNLLEESRFLEISLETDTLEYALRKSLERLAADFSSDPGDMERLKGLEGALGILDLVSFPINLWTLQNICYRVLNSFYPEQREKGDPGAGEWIRRFAALCERLSVYVAT
ncbi:MAG: DUF3536 domain-containing protein, partial [Deltaproteobacteria bacterium]|nr:DUF3536 domain-containing protein [Deltaproteobacteria bacterium]